jgi:adenine-specific DNA-methyltransferase
MAKADYTKLEKEELINIIRDLQNKKYGLVWDEEATREQFERDSLNAFPFLREVKTKGIDKDIEGPVNILIEGDNYHSLSVLNYTHQDRVDVIYIDPPFNTGSQTWKYNNKFVEPDDPWKHSKWLSMMKKRLVLAKRLLKSDGAIIVAIDDYEVHHLGLLLEAAFPSYERDLVIVEHHPQGAGSNTVSRTHEYAFICTPAGIGLRGREVRSEDNDWSLKRSGQGENNWRAYRPKQFFAIHVDEKKRRVVGVGPEIPREHKKYPDGKTEDGYLRIYPTDRAGKERCWRYNRETMLKNIKKGIIEYTKQGSLVINKTTVAAEPVFSIWQGSRYNAGTHGSSLLTKMMGKANTFPYPKSIYTVIDMLNAIIKNNPAAVVLDFFAGSGTTGHAILKMNQDDGGKRQFILCTNNEGNICEDVCYPRIKKAIEGYKYNGNEKEMLFEKRLTVKDIKDNKKIIDEITEIEGSSDGTWDKVESVVEDGVLRVYGVKKVDGKQEGLGGNLKYFKTDFVKRSLNIDQTKINVTNECTEMLCLREGVFEPIKEAQDYKIFKQGEKIMAVFYSFLNESLQELRKDLNKLKGSKILYCFTLDAFGLNKDNFVGWDDVKMEPIPQKILDIYEEIYEY